MGTSATGIRSAGEAIGKVSQLADVCAEICGDHGGVELRICCDRTEPPVGRLWRETVPGPTENDADDPVEFSGWLGLLRVLADALGNPGAEGDESASL